MNEQSALTVGEVQTTWFWRLSIIVLFPLLRLLFRLKVHRRSNLPEQGPAILAANHASYLDPPVVGVGAWPRVIHFMAKESLFRKPLLGWIIRRLHAFPVAREELSRETIRTAISALSRGEFVGVFPQGTRIRDGSLELTRGVALLADRTGAPVVPIGISGTEKVWRGGPMPLRLPKVEVIFGEPIEFKRDPRLSSREERDRFTAELREEISRLLGVLKSPHMGEQS